MHKKFLTEESQILQSSQLPVLISRRLINYLNFVVQLRCGGEIFWVL